MMFLCVPAGARRNDSRPDAPQLLRVRPLPARFDPSAASAPFDDALLHAVGAKPLLPEKRHGLDGHHAVRSATVRDDVLVLRQFGEPLLQLGKWNGARARDVASTKFLRGPPIEDCRFA